MKLATKLNCVRRSETFEETTFTIEASAKAFKILSSTLYSNKINAIVRELSCNAYDAHIEAGKPTTPFVIHLPSYVDRTFRIRDFGPGISPKNIRTVYTRYFASTKTHSNDMIGCLGLGSKTPFSYTDNFSVISRYKSTKYVYSAFISESGEPTVALIASEPTTDPDGLEVQLAVKDKDFYLFELSASEVFRWFKILPSFEGASPRQINNKIIKEESGEGWFISSSHQGPKALMGNVAYKIDASELDALLPKGLVQLLRSISPVLEFPIGALEPNPNRETLSLNKRTVNSLKKRLESVKKTLDEMVEKKIQEATCKWNAALALNDLRSGVTGRYVQNSSNEFSFLGEPLKKSYLARDIFKPHPASPVPRNEVCLTRGQKFYFEKQWRSGKLATKYRPYKVAAFEPKKDDLFIFVDHVNNKRKFTESSFRAWMRAFSDTYHDATFRVFERKEGENEYFEEIISGLGMIEKEHFFYWHDMPKTPKKISVRGGGAGGRKKTSSKLVALNPAGDGADRWGDFEKVSLENGAGAYVARKGTRAFRNKKDLDLGTDLRNLRALVHTSQAWDAYAKVQTPPLVPIGRIYSFTPNQLASLGPGWVPAKDLIDSLGKKVFTEKVARNIYFAQHSPKIDETRIKLLKLLTTSLPELLNLPSFKAWKEYLKKDFGLGEGGKFISQWNSAQNHNDRLFPDSSKYQSSNTKLISGISLLWESLPLLSLIERKYTYDIRNWKQSALSSQIKEWEEIVNYTKFKENL